MGKIAIANVDRGAPAARPDEIGVEGKVETCRVVGDEPDRPLSLWTHRLAPGAVIRWTAPKVGRVVFLWEGGITVNGAPMHDEGAVVVEHRSDCEIKAGPGGCTLLEFHQRPELACEDAGAGGHVHALSSEQAPGWISPTFSMKMYADADCPTCRMWLHANVFDDPLKGSRHYHTSDEIIVCKGGRISFGTVEIGRGDVLAINANALYSFETTVRNTSFINFRPGPSKYARVTKEGHSPMIDELDNVRANKAPPAHAAAAAAGQLFGA